MLADEPTASIDTRLAGPGPRTVPPSGAQQDRAILIVSHDPKVRGIADRVIQIQDGQLLE